MKYFLIVLLMSIGYVVIILFHPQYWWCTYLFLYNQSVVGFTHFVDHFKEPVLAFLLCSAVCFLFRPLFIYFWLHWVFRVVLGFSVAALGLCPVVVSRGYSLVTVPRLLTVVASLMVENGLYGTWAQQLWDMGLVAPWHVGFELLDQGLSQCPLPWQVDS